MASEKPDKHTTHTCPVWAGYLLVCPLRRIFHNPETILKPYVKEGMKVLEVGPGMGFFTLPLAEMVGPEGMVYAVDIQEKMLEVLKNRAKKKGLSRRIETILATGQSLGISHLSNIDFCLLFAVVHEVPYREKLFEEIGHVLGPEGYVLMAEPKGHVSKDSFQEFIDIAKRKGFTVVSEQKIFRSRAVLLKKTPQHPKAS
ncbi:MAG: class I SAM-dependent methyltransferase [Nitrospirae bacterium]|nr:MAG: class I SAM-dependent methyltransferase [Nitrospirota bacterium]